jgi:hypothetical protein
MESCGSSKCYPNNTSCLAPKSPKISPNESPDAKKTVI